MSFKKSAWVFLNYIPANSVRIFLGECPECESVEITVAAWIVESARPELGILHAYARCINSDCNQHRFFVMNPKATGCDLRDEKDLVSQRLRGTPYAVSACGVMPYTNNNDRQ